MRFGTGSYNVRHSEGLNPDTLQSSSNSKQTLNCTIYFLDDTERTFTIGRGAIGQEILDKVFEHLELVERDFFGLQFLSFLDSQAEHPRMRWLDPQKSIRKQMVCSPFNLYFRVKFYVSDPSKLAEEYTRYHFFLQVKRDLIEGRLICPESSAALLASYAIQSEVGDYNCNETDDNYINNFKIIPNQSLDLTKQIKELHKLHAGQTPAAAEYNFLDHAKRLDMYGVDLYEAHIDDGISILVGVNSYGICLFQNTQKINAYPWCSIMKLTFKKKIFNVVIRILNELNEEEDKVFCFHIITSQSCKLLWKSCIEHHTFFRLIAPPIPPPKSIFSLGSRYRYSGRTEFQTMEEMKRRARVERAFMRANSRNNFNRATITGIGTRNCGPSSQQNTLEKITERDLNKLGSAFDDADRGEYTLKSNNSIYNFKQYEDRCMSSDSIRNSITSQTSWVAKIFPSGHWKKKQYMFRKNFTLNKSLRINNNGSSTSNSSITSFFHKLIPKLESSRSSMIKKDDYTENDNLRMLNHRKIDEFDGLNYKKNIKSTF